jgi:prepilin-type N-terminal cleavage/methylation domain-containing protein
MHGNLLLKRKKSGFTLVEIMVSMIVLALLASGFFSILVSARYLVNRSAFRAAAVEVANAGLERMKTLVRADTWWVPGSPLALKAWTDDWVVSPDNSAFFVRYKVEAVAGCECRAVTVQVKWDVPKI